MELYFVTLFPNVIALYTLTTYQTAVLDERTGSYRHFKYKVY